MNTGPQCRQLQSGCQVILRATLPKKPEKMHLPWCPCPDAPPNSRVAVANPRVFGYIRFRRPPCRSLNSSAGNAGRSLKKSCPLPPPRWLARIAKAPRWRNSSRYLPWEHRRALPLHLSLGPAAHAAQHSAGCAGWRIRCQVSGARCRLQNSKLKVRNSTCPANFEFLISSFAQP